MALAKIALIARPDSTERLHQLQERVAAARKSRNDFANVCAVTGARNEERGTSSD
jgi:hypothetical protein